MRTTGAAAAGVTLTGAKAAAQSSGTLDATKPDVALVNGRVMTMDDELASAEAFASKNGRFVAIGSNDDIRNVIDHSTEVIDAEGLTVTPGFIDAHSHPADGGVREIVSVNLDLRSIDAIKDAIRARAAKTPRGEWVMGFKYDDTKVREGRQINRKTSTRPLRTTPFTSLTAAATSTGSTPKPPKPRALPHRPPTLPAGIFIRMTTASYSAKSPSAPAPSSAK